MANATASKKASDKKDDKPAAEKAAPKREVKRSSARVTLAQTKVVESQYDAQGKRIESLDAKLVEVIKAFEDKPEHAFAVAATEAREELAKAAEALVASKEKFEQIGEGLRDFFA